jgi:DNA polymerase-3 subunit gamma/tau
MCAQVLLPGAATDEKSLLARLERLEKGTPRQVPQSPPRAPYPVPDDEAERARVPSPAARPTPQPPERTQAASPPVRPAPEPPEPARPVPPAPAPAPATRAPVAAGSGSSPADPLRQNWDAILDAVKQERRVAWMLLSNASVLSLEDGILTLRFPRDGDVKGFSVSGHDAVLKRVLSNNFGLNVTIKGVAGGDAAAAGGVRPGRPGPGVPEAARPPAVRRDPVPAPSQSAPPEFAGPEFADPYDEPDDMPPGEMPEDEPSPDDRAVQGAELTGMDLIQRELGGQVIGEIEG